MAAGDISATMTLLELLLFFFAFLCAGYMTATRFLWERLFLSTDGIYPLPPFGYRMDGSAYTSFFSCVRGFLEIPPRRQSV